MLSRTKRYNALDAAPGFAYEGDAGVCHRGLLPLAGAPLSTVTSRFSHGKSIFRLKRTHSKGDAIRIGNDPGGTVSPYRS